MPDVLVSQWATCIIEIVFFFFFLSFFFLFFSLQVLRSDIRLLLANDGELDAANVTSPPLPGPFEQNWLFSLKRLHLSFEIRLQNAKDRWGSTSMSPTCNKSSAGSFQLSSPAARSSLPAFQPRRVPPFTGLLEVVVWSPAASLSLPSFQPRRVPPFTGLLEVVV